MNTHQRILVIDDDPIQLKVIQNILTSNNFDVCTANNGALGIQKAFEYNPDLILCDINMNTIDGYQVYNVLKESSLIEQIPFIFISGNSELQDIRFGLDLGADDYFVKPICSQSLLLALEKKISKFKKLKEVGKHEFKALFQLSPNGIFLFDEHVIFDANPALIRFLGVEGESMTSYSIKDIIDSGSFQAIGERIHRCSKGLLNSFSETIYLKTGDQKKIKVKLFVSVYEKFTGYSLMLGLITPITNNEENDEFGSDVLRVIKRENMISHSLPERQFSEIRQTQAEQMQGFFSRRETEVLCLSMEGLPTKLIADRLSISDRTVEKHRANLMEKTNSKNIIEVIIYALRHNLIEV